MRLKKVSSREASDLPALEAATDELLNAMLEPYPGQADEEVMASLREAGATNVSLLAPGFISAQAHPQTLKALETRAHIHLKPKQQLRAQAKRR